MGYHLLSDLITIATLVPFIYIFGAAFRSGGRWSGIVGGSVTALATVLVALPPPEAEPWRYAAKVVGGCVVLAVIGRWLFVSSARSPAGYAPPEGPLTDRR